MVFGWGKKKEEIPVAEIPKDKEILLSDVSEIIVDLQKLRESQTISEVKHLRDKTVPLMEDLTKIGNFLENDSLDVEDIDKHLAIIVVRGKKQVIHIIQKDVIPLPDVSTIDDAKKLYSTLNLILKKIGDVLGRQTRVIHIFAKKYASQLKDNLEIMNANRSEIQDILKNYDSSIEISKNISEVLKQIETLKTTKIKKTQKISDTEKNIEITNGEISSLKESIEEIKSSDDYQKFITAKNTLSEFGSQKLNLKNEINSQFTKISRPLGRYEYASSLDKEQKNILSKMVENPFDVMFPENKDSIVLILENIRKAVSSGSISVKDTEKTLTQISEIQITIDQFITSVTEYFEKYKKMENDLNLLRSEHLISLENELEKKSTFFDDLNRKLDNHKAEIIEITSKIPQLVSGIENKLRQFSNTRYTISKS